MSLSFARRSSAALTAVLLVLGPVFALCASADGAVPKTGKFRYYTPAPDTPGAVKDAVFFEVGDIRGGKFVEEGASWISDVCGRMEIPKSLPVSQKGKAKYKGLATRAGGTAVKVKVTITFTKKSKATVSLKDQDPALDCGVLKGTARHYS